MNPSTVESVKTQCCIVGGGPAGMMLGLLLARSGVKVTVLEKHVDFFRDFRGDTIHPSTLELLYELDYLEEFLRLPHQPVSQLSVTINGKTVAGPDFSHLPTRCKFIAFTPQWHFLDFLARKAKSFPSFDLRMGAEMTDLLREGDRVTGVRAKTAAGDVEIAADLVVGADGRGSTVRQAAGLEVEEFGVPIDVLWYRLTRKTSEIEQSFGYFKQGKMLILINRGEYWQCGHIVPKGSLEILKQRGLPAFHANIVDLVPSLSDVVAELDDWSKVKLLTVQVNRLPQWAYPGLLCIGDCAHAMSPAGGIGVNIAIQDAVAAANFLAVKLRNGNCTLADLQAVQKHRLWAIKLTQNLQLFLHRKLLTPRLDADASDKLPLGPRLVGKIPFLRRLIARVVGIGFQPEHVQTKPAAPRVN